MRTCRSVVVAVVLVLSAAVREHKKGKQVTARTLLPYADSPMLRREGGLRRSLLETLGGKNQREVAERSSSTISVGHMLCETGLNKRS